MWNNRETQNLRNGKVPIEFSLNVFTKFTEFSDKNNIRFYFKKIAVLEPTFSCVRDRDSTTGPRGHS